MPHVTQMLKDWTRTHGNLPFWVVEKDYALSYLLAGIANVESLREGLLLKGGTALKKAYFANYRFSEDLDYSACPGVVLGDVYALMQRAVDECRQLLQERGPLMSSWSG